MAILVNGKKMAEMIGVCQATLNRYARDHRIPRIQMSRTFNLFDPDAVLAALEAAEHDEALGLRREVREVG